MVADPFFCALPNDSVSVAIPGLYSQPLPVLQESSPFPPKVSLPFYLQMIPSLYDPWYVGEKYLVS